MNVFNKIYIFISGLFWYGIYGFYKWLHKDYKLWSTYSLERSSIAYVISTLLCLITTIGMVYLYFFKKRHGWDDTKPSLQVLFYYILFIFMLDYAVFTIYYYILYGLS